MIRPLCSFCPLVLNQVDPGVVEVVIRALRQNTSLTSEDGTRGVDQRMSAWVKKNRCEIYLYVFPYLRKC